MTAGRINPGERSAPSEITRPSSRGIPPETLVFCIVASITVLTYLFADWSVSALVQASVMAVLVAVMGLPHGALDPVIARRLGLWRGAGSLMLFLFAYAALSVLVVGAWRLAPVAALSGFLAMSAMHFSGDWEFGRHVVLRLVSGAALLSAPSVRDVEEVATLYSVLAGPTAANIATVQAAAGPYLLVGLLVAAAVVARRRLCDGIELLLATALALIAPPLVFFTVYFCCLHSARHLRESLVSNRHTLSSKATITIAGGAIVLPIGVAIMHLTNVERSSLDAGVLQVVFIGLAALTVPHMILVHLDQRAVQRCG